jgi:hypothetical protein
MLWLTWADYKDDERISQGRIHDDDRVFRGADYTMTIESLHV